MKLAWLCYDELGDVVIEFMEPGQFKYCKYAKIVPIVYAVVEEE